ncbi:MAG TPA: thioredoxin family protein [Usitatibacter sp.]|nr:thioredoxin family protein [Usitatibacter sp.]
MLSFRPLALAALLPLAAVAAPIYPDPSRAAADIDAALREASATHRRVLVDFGGDWCTDCKVLDAYLKRPENAALVARGYVVVHVNVGARGIDRNFEVARRYGIPLEKGVPALAVLGADGKVVYSQRNGEFESMRRMDSKSVNEFLARWAP